MRDRTLLAVLTAFTVTVFLLLLSSWLSMRILSGVRAYVAGEGLYSKAQKNAIFFLALYVQTGDESWYRSFEHALQVPEGDRDARLELERPRPDWAAVRRGFIAGGNSPEDIADLVFVFRNLGSTPYMSAAVAIWTQGDADIGQLRTLGARIRQQRASIMRGAADAFASSSLVELETLNGRLTRLEDRFSATLGVGARATERILLLAIVSLSAMLWVTGCLMFWRLISALAREHETLRAVLENTPIGIVLVEAPNGRIRLGNSYAFQVLGEPVDTYINSERATGWQARDSTGLLLEWSDYPVAKALRGDVIRSQDLQWLRPGGASIWLRVSAAPIRRRGRIAGAVTAFYDVTEERKVEEALVRQSQELARSNADLEQFAYTTSHDLQEPLRNISVYSQLLAKRYRTQLSSDADMIIDAITSSVERMNALIRDLLAYSRVDNLNAAPMNAVDLNNVVDWAYSNLKVKIEENQAVIDAQQLPTVRGDKIQLVQVFQNLLENGIKYRSAAPPRISISAGKAGGGWIITVRDNGLGIDARYHERIFGLFKRLHGREVPGTGIGLALAKRVIERHGGRIWVESSVGQGSAFRFTLPGFTTPAAQDLDCELHQQT